jgi:GrpB-like predicted nucleotidyltransferase (UPF0157 family)
MAKFRSTRARVGRAPSGRPFSLVEPDPEWPARFADEAARIRAALGDVAMRIEHIGSTAVPGLPSKPIIDIQVSVASLAPRDPWRRPLEAAGYEHRVDPSSVEHEFLCRNAADGSRLVNLHVCPAESAWERRHLWFRDHLRHHPEDRDAYAALKRRLAVEHRNDVHTYSDAKTAFIREVERRADVQPAVAMGD